MNAHFFLSLPDMIDETLKKLGTRHSRHYQRRYCGRIVILTAMACSDLQKVLPPHAFQRHRYASVFSRYPCSPVSTLFLHYFFPLFLFFLFLLFASFPLEPLITKFPPNFVF